MIVIGENFLAGPPLQGKSDGADLAHADAMAPAGAPEGEDDGHVFLIGIAVDGEG